MKITRNITQLHELSEQPMYLANLSSRSDPARITQRDNAVPTLQFVPGASPSALGDQTNLNVPPVTPQNLIQTSGTTNIPVHTSSTETQNILQTNVMVKYDEYHDIMMQKVIDKEGKEDCSQKTLEQRKLNNVTIC